MSYRIVWHIPGHPGEVICRSDELFATNADAEEAAYTVSRSGVMDDCPDGPAAYRIEGVLDELIATVRAAVKRYDETRDHRHGGGPSPGDCVRCLLQDFMQKTRGSMESLAQNALRIAKIETEKAEIEIRNGWEPARRCLIEANMAFKRQDFKHSYDRALDSLLHSVGKLSPRYQEAKG